MTTNTNTNRLTTLLRALRGRRQQRASATTTIDLRGTTPGMAAWSPRDTESLIREGYETAVWVYAAVNAITRLAKQTRWILTDAAGQELEQHPLLTLLARPNEEQTGAALLEAAVGYYLIAGNTYLERVGTEAGPPVELWVKRPDRMSVIPGARGTSRIAAYQYDANGGRYTFEPWQIRHVKTWAPRDEWYGMSPISAAARGIDLLNTGQAQNLALMQNGARPTGAFISEGTLTDQQFTRMKEDLADAQRARRAAPMILEGGVKWQEMGITPRELDWLAGQTDAARQIHAAFGVHPVLTGLEAGTYENQRQAQRGLLINVLLPIIDQFTADLNAWLTPLFTPRGLRLTYDRDAYPALAEDEAALWERGLRAYQQGVITLNEARSMIGYDVTPDGDTFRGATLGFLNATPPTRTRATPPRDSFARSRERLQRTWETRLRAWLADRFDEERREIQRRARHATTEGDLRTAVEDVINTNNTLDGLAAWWLAAAAAGAEHTAKAHDFPTLTRATTAPTTRAKTPDLDPILDLLRALWGIYFDGSVEKASTHYAKVVGEVSTTTLNALRDLITDGITGGLSIPDIAATIDTLYLEQIIPNRSTVIARTETISSTNYGGQTAARATGLTLKKRWLATSDDRTREAHVDADGQTRDLDEPYIVNGEPLMYPGDPAGSAANVIQCRCTETYEEAQA